MSWLFPGFLFGATAIGLPLLLHLLRRRPKRTVVFPSLRFLAATQRQTERWQRVLRWIVLALRCAALALLAAVFARPFFGAVGKGGGRVTVVVVDNSFSMQAAGRWPALRLWARQQIGVPETGDKIGLLLMAPRPVWLAPLNTDASAALTLLEQDSPGWQAARIEPALRLAADALAATPAAKRQLIVLSDHQRVSWAGFNFEKKLPPGVIALFPPVPPAVARQAALGPPALTRTPSGFRATLKVQNFTAAQTRQLRVFRDGAKTPLLQQSLSLAERETQTLTLDLPATAAAEDAYFRFALDDDDLPADDSAYAVWRATGEHTVLLDAAPPGGADFIGAALAATAELKPSLQVAPIPSGTWPAAGVAILRNNTTFTGESAARLNAFLRAGGAALIFVNGSPAQSAWLANTAGIKPHAVKSDAGLQVRDWAMDHPLVSALSTHGVSGLLGWEFRRGWALPADVVDPLALWSGSETGVALGETNGSAGRMLLCGFSPDRRDTEWPVHEVFVPFIHRAVAHLLGEQSSSAAKPTFVGEAIALPADTGDWRALDGPAAAAPVAAALDAATPDAPGIYAFGQGPGRKLFAVNLAPEESDPASWSNGRPWLGLASSEPAPAAARVKLNLAAVDAEQRSPLWWWLVAALGLIALAEIGLANRTAR